MSQEVRSQSLKELAGKDVMINALTQSPIVGKKIFEWKEQIENQQLLVRDIIDIDSTYENIDSLDDNGELKVSEKQNQKKILIKRQHKKKRKMPQAKMMNLMFHWQKWKKKQNQK